MNVTEKAEKRDLLFVFLKKSVEKCYADDFTLIRRDMERASVARIFVYMNEFLNSEEDFKSLLKYDLDSEYNRYMSQPKYISSRRNGALPDVILHRREDKPYKDNLLIAEFKAHGKEPKDDFKKIENFISEPKYEYFLGIFVELNHSGAKYWYLQNGEDWKELN